MMEAPMLPFSTLVESALMRRAIIASAMGLTAITLIYSPWGQRSGAHFNPAVTLTFFRLGKLAPWDAGFYIIAQFLGGIGGITLVATVLKGSFTDPPVRYIVTVPGIGGWAIALATEFLLAFGMMSMVLWTANTQRVAHYTGLFAGILVAIYIFVAAPLSGMSMNPARSFASALSAHIWTAFWIYYFAPPLGMLSAAELYLKVTKRHPKTLCGKLCPNRETPCLCKNCCCQIDGE
jgi:aquaporin Z